MGFILRVKPIKEIYGNLGLEENGKLQAFLDERVSTNLMKYVSLKSRTQLKSIPIASKYGSGRVIINVPYARFQAEGKVMVGVRSRRAWAMKHEKKEVINKRLTYHNGSLRGAHPFERMKADKRDSILLETAKLARRLSDG